MAADLDKLFQEHELNESVLQAFDTMGENQARLLMDQVTREYFEPTSIVGTIGTYCARLWGSISRGMAECTRKVSKATNKNTSGTGYVNQDDTGDDTETW